MIAGIDGGSREISDPSSKLDSAVVDWVSAFRQMGELAVEFILSSWH
ncbi:hypothetical protein CCUG60885_01131 [Mycobacteroides salmoniphilum]|uniref:Uncharacterized protein n=1 Tax=Mycobacteroides salmoniphilum TaxID=404941 RepID=A0A4R8SK65_9MYCO|nr:hypothetical protein CCUG60885_01131 [Mycobacteroides salmoniphilum]TEA01812.1 hypothetical protein CCUG60883_04351 [Mycobacteroides salmoniphilum]